MKQLFILLFISFFSLVLEGQTAPAGVSNSLSNVFWLKADAGTSSTVNLGSISTWSDQSGNGINVSQATASQQPSFATNIMNGFPSVEFDNVATTNDKLIGPDSPLLDNTSGYSFFMVNRPKVMDGAARVIVSKRTGVAIDQSFMQFYFSTNRFYTDIQTNNNRYNTSAAFAANTNYLIDQFYDGTLAAASRCETYIANNLDVTANETNTLVPDNASPIVVGSTDATDPRPFGGYISEIIIYRTALNIPSRNIIDNYLSAKYNIALASNDFYAGDTPANGNYDYEVAGVGKDATGSNPSFSASISGGIGISTTGAGFDNGDYILAGHATFTNSQVMSDVGGMTGSNNARWSRIWYVDITNTSTNINTNVEFDMSDGDVGAVAVSTPTNYKLIYRAGQTGTWTEVATANSISGDRILFNGFTFVNDGYYTIGTLNHFISPLPIELLDFKAKLNGAEVDLNWSTASEKQNKYFEIQKSKDAINFEFVTEILGATESNSTKVYTTKDTDPYSGISYYRLKQVDLNGDTWYSKIVSVLNTGSDFEIRVMPNPAKQAFSINFSTRVSGELTYWLSDAVGATILKSSALLNNEEKLTINPDKILSPGIYFINISIADKGISAKVIIE